MLIKESEISTLKIGILQKLRATGSTDKRLGRTSGDENSLKGNFVQEVIVFMYPNILNNRR